jgi:hypothetical protein
MGRVSRIRSRSMTGCLTGSMTGYPNRRVSLTGSMTGRLVEC